MAVEHETILKAVLFPLTVKVPLSSAISVRSLVRKLKPFHPWLDENSLREFVVNYQKKPSFNKQLSSFCNSASSRPSNNPVSSVSNGSIVKHKGDTRV